MHMLRTWSAADINGLASCVTYAFCSISMVLANKTLLSKYDFSFPLSLLFFQSTTSVVLVSVAKRLVPHRVQYPAFQWKIARKWLPVTLGFMAMLLTGFMSLQQLAVPMVTVFKNLTNILIVLGERYLYDQAISQGVMVSVLLMVVGAVAASKHDGSFSLSGYLWMVANCISTASYVLIVRGMSKQSSLSQFGMVYYNNVLTLMVLPLLIFLFGEFPMVAYSPTLHSPGFMLCACFSGAVGFVLNFASFWCVGATSGTTYAIVGALNKIPLTFLGALLFDAVITRPQGCYIALSMAGGFLYSYTKLMDKKARDKAEAEREGLPVHAKVVSKSTGQEVDGKAALRTTSK